ncbi:tetratricopeptide repeat protein, partial [bacterium]|nr:tetratricopeptide repeat protein [bacterium]
VSDEDQMLFRVGLNLGDVIIEGDNLYGDGVNVAARLEAAAEPGGITLSGKFHDEVSRKLDMSFISTGEQVMKNITNPVPTYKIEVSALTKPEASSKTEPSIETSAEDQGSTSDQALDEKPPAIAVLPFANMSGDPDQEYFADGITEDIITNLSLWKTFPVISRNSSFTFKNKSVNLKDVSDELRARYIVEGSVRKGGNRIRITAQLIDAYSDHHLWSKKWDRNIDDIFEVQDEVSASIAAQVNPTLGSYETERIERSKPNNFNAWEYYLKSLQMFNERSSTDGKDDNLAKSRELCEKAIELDPGLTHGHSMLARICLQELLQFINEDSEKTLNDMYEHSKKASELDPQNPVAALTTSTYYFFKGKFKQSRKYAEKAVELNPSYPEAHMRLAQAITHSGDYVNSEEFLRKSVELNPLDPEKINMKSCYFFIYMGIKDFQKAYELIEEVVEEFPNTVYYKGFKASVMGYLNKVDEAKQVLNEYLELRPNLKTKDDYKRIFVTNSSLADILIEGLCMAGWEPED